MSDATHLDGHRLRGALVAACDAVQGYRGELNRINVFPVPDGDTGTNLALTTAAIADHLRGGRQESASEVAHAAAEAAILGARGNCGMILSHYLLGFAEGLAGRAQVSVDEFVIGLRAGATHVYGALDRPVEGTIITIMRVVAEEAERPRSSGFAATMRELVGHAKEALERTPELLPALKAAGVVDAGAKGFVHLLEGLASHLAGESPPQAPEDVRGDDVAAPVAAARFGESSETYRYCTEALVRGEALPDSEEVRAVLREWGDSLVVIRSAELLKIHVHTDDPERVLEYLRGLGSLAAHKAEDMRAQHAAVGRAAGAGGHLRLARRPVTIVTDSGCDLPEEIVRAHGIHVVPLNVIVDDRVLRDGVDIDAGGFLDVLDREVKATTSQPPPAAFVEAYGRAWEDGEETVGIFLASALSGTFASAEAAARHWTAGSTAESPRAPIHLFDSRGASLTQGLLVLKAAELAESGASPREIMEILARIRDHAGIFFTLDGYERLLASGRVGRGRAMLGTLLDIKPILGLAPDGTVATFGKVRGAANVLPRMLGMLEREIGGARRVRFGIMQVAAEDAAERAAEAIRARFGPNDIVVSPATPVIANHTGRGTWGIAYQVED